MKCSLPEAAAPAQLGSAVFLFAFFSFSFIRASPLPAAQIPNNTASARQRASHRVVRRCP